MGIDIINNLSTNNHGIKIKDLIAAADTITIARPYLLPDFIKYFSDLGWDDSKSLHLITTLVPKSEDQVRKIKSLYSLITYSGKHHINCRISLNNRLHGKVYIFRQGTAFKAAIVSSANMTDNGMHHLHEWGILLDDPEIAEEIHRQLVSSIEYKNVNHADILEMYLKTKDYLAKNKVPKPARIPLKLTDLIKGRPAMRLTSSNRYWLKPIGHTHRHVNPDESYHQKNRHLHFSVNEPKDVSIGDVLIALAVDSGKILSVYRVLSKPQFDPTEDRWPWYVESQNLTVDFGRNWWQQGLTKEYLKMFFEKEHPDVRIKPRGSQSFGAFNWGWDRLEITKKFGDFIIDQVLARKL